MKPRQKRDLVGRFCLMHRLNEIDPLTRDTELQGRFLAVRHLDPVYPRLGFVFELGAQTLDFHPSKIRLGIRRLVHRFGFCALPTLTERQRAELQDPASYNWSILPSRTPFSSFPHTDAPFGPKKMGFFWRKAAISNDVTIGFSAYAPALTAVRRSLPALRPQLSKNPCLNPISRFEAGVKRMERQGELYTSNGIVRAEVDRVFSTLHHSMVDPNSDLITDKLHTELRKIGVWVSYADYELLAVSDRILHWGGDGSLNEEVLYAEV